MDFDKDLAARQEARALSRQAEKARKILSAFPQEKLDEIVEAVAKLTGLGTDRISVLKMK